MNAKTRLFPKPALTALYAAFVMCLCLSGLAPNTAFAQERAIWRAETVVDATDTTLPDGNLVEDQDQIGNPPEAVGNGAQVNLDSSPIVRTHACSGVPCARNPCDFVLEVTEWEPANTNASLDPVFVGDDVFQVIALITASTDAGPPTSACLSYDIPGGGLTPENDPITAGEWRIEVLLDINGDGIINDDDIDPCDVDGIEVAGTTCGRYTFNTTQGGNETDTVVSAIIPITDIITVQDLNGTPPVALDLTNQLIFRVRADPDTTTPAPSGQRLFIKDLQINVLRGDEFTDGVLTWSSSFYDFSGPAASAGFLKGQAFVVTDGSETARVDVSTSGLAADLAWNADKTPPGSAIPLSGTVPPGTTESISVGFETWYLAGTPLASSTGGAVAAGTHTFRLGVLDTTTSDDLSYQVDLVIDGADIQVQGQLADRARELPPITPGEFTSITFEASDANFGSARNSAGTYTWTLDAIPALELDGLSFSNGIGTTPGGSAAGLTSITLSGIPEGDNPISFDLSIADTNFGSQSAAEQTAYRDTVSFSSNYSQDFVILGQKLPPVYQGMTYDVTTKYATLRVAGVPAGQFCSDNAIAPDLSPVVSQTSASPDNFTDTRFIPPGNERLQLIPVAQGTPGGAGTFGLDNSALIDIYSNPATFIPVDNADAGRFTFTVDVLDNTAVTPNVASQQFEVRVPMRRTKILQGPPRVTEDSKLTFTVFAEGGVPTTGTIFTGEVGADEAVNLTSGSARYRYNVSIAAQDDSGAYVENWITQGNFPAATQNLLDPGIDPAGFARSASPVTFSVDLNDPAIASTDDTLRPSAGTGRRYRVTVLAEDAVRREVPPVLVGRGADMDAAQSVIRIVDDGGEDTNPNTLNPNRLRQNRYD